MKTAGQETDALVLRRFDYSENSQIARLYTRSDGRISVIAKGIKKPNPDLRGPIDLFCEAEVAFRGRRQDELQVLTRYRVRTGFPGLRRQLERLVAAFYLTELLCDGTRDFDPDSRLFDLWLATFRALEEASPAETAVLVIRAELGFLEASGFLPSFASCVGCGREPALTASVRVSPGRGGIVCSACVPRDVPGLITLSAGLRRTFLALLEADPARATRIALLPRDRATARRLLDRMVEHVLEKELRSARFLSRSLP